METDQQENDLDLPPCQPALDEYSMAVLREYRKVLSEEWARLSKTETKDGHPSH